MLRRDRPSVLRMAARAGRGFTGWRWGWEGVCGGEEMRQLLDVLGRIMATLWWYPFCEIVLEFSEVSAVVTYIERCNCRCGRSRIGELVDIRDFESREFSWGNRTGGESDSRESLDFKPRDKDAEVLEHVRRTSSKSSSYL